MSLLFDSFAWLLDHWWYFHIFAVAGVLAWVLFGKGTWFRSAKFFLYAAVFSVLIVMVSTFFPFIGGKDYFFRTSVGLALIFFVFWWAFEAKPGECRERAKQVFASPIVVAVSLFALVFLLASVFAHDPHAAFWSNYERGEGAFQMLHYWAFFVMLVFAFRGRREWELMLKMSLAAAALMIAYGFAANLGIGHNLISPYSGGDPATYQSYSAWRRLTEARFQGSLGNPAYVAPYLLFSLFYAAFLWLGGRISARRNSVYAVLAAALFFFFMISQTRATFIGLGFAALTFILYLIFAVRPWRKFLAPILLILLVVGAAGLYWQDAEFVRNLPGGRVFDISFDTQELRTRTWTWGSAWRGFLERPILGWGPENFATVFDRHFDPRHHVPGGNTETWFDRAHSAYFDYLSETGVLGLAAYLGVFAAFFYVFRKSSKAPRLSENNREAEDFFSEERREKIVRGLFLALVVGYLVQNVAIFEVLPMYVNLFLFLALANFYFYGRKKLNEKELR